MFANIRFRRDGLLTSWQPILAQVQPVIEAYVAALNDGDSERLSQLLDRDYLQIPQGSRRADLVHGKVSRLQAQETLSDLQIIDAVAVGDIATVWLRATWQVESRDGRTLSFSEWNLQVQLRRTTPGYRVLSLGPYGRLDQGVLTAAGYQGPERLGVQLSPPDGVFMRRGHDGPSEVQVECLLRDQQSASFALFGDYTEPGRDAELIMHMLTQGALSARPGRRLPGPRVAFLGSADAGTLLQVERIQDWLFGRPDGDSWARERWIFVQLGRRWFWIRERAVGSSPDEAKQRFRAAAASFVALEKSLHIR